MTGQLHKGTKTVAATSVPTDSTVREAARLFRDRLVHVTLSWPKSQTELQTTELEISLDQFMESLLAIDSGAALKPAESAGVPTPRLRRAIANANKIVQGRFATSDQLFEALGQAVEG